MASLTNKKICLLTSNSHLCCFVHGVCICRRGVAAGLCLPRIMVAILSFEERFSIQFCQYDASQPRILCHKCMFVEKAQVEEIDSLVLHSNSTVNTTFFLLNMFSFFYFLIFCVFLSYTVSLITITRTGMSDCGVALFPLLCFIRVASFPRLDECWIQFLLFRVICYVEYDQDPTVVRGYEIQAQIF